MARLKSRCKLAVKRISLGRQPMTNRRYHSTAGAGQIRVGQFRQANQFFSLGVARVLSHKEFDMRVIGPSIGNGPQLATQFLWMSEMDDPPRGIIGRPKAF